MMSSHQADAARIRRKMANRDREMRSPYKGSDPLSMAAYEAGGVSVRVNLLLPVGENGGCGTPTHVAGTNGGKMPCGSLLTRFGKTKPYYCGCCDLIIRK